MSPCCEQCKSVLDQSSDCFYVAKQEMYCDLTDVIAALPKMMNGEGKHVDKLSDSEEGIETYSGHMTPSHLLFMPRPFRLRLRSFQAHHYVQRKPIQYRCANRHWLYASL